MHCHFAEWPRCTQLIKVSLPGHPAAFAVFNRTRPSTNNLFLLVVKGKYCFHHWLSHSPSTKWSDCGWVLGVCFNLFIEWGGGTLKTRKSLRLHSSGLSHIKEEMATKRKWRREKTIDILPTHQKFTNESGHKPMCVWCLITVWLFKMFVPNVIFCFNADLTLEFSINLWQEAQQNND